MTQLLYQLMEDPSLMTENTLSKLRKMIEQYPCFAVAKLLYLKNLSALNDKRFDTELRRLSISIPDRRRLFFLIKDHLDRQYTTAVESEQIEEGGANDTFTLIDLFLSTRTPETADGEVVFQPTVSSDYLYWAQRNEPIEPSVVSVKLEHQDLIDSFINENREYSFRDKTKANRQEKTAVPDDLEEVPDDLFKLQDDSFFTETLAHVYIKQKRYERALQIIKNLSLKYPEKNIYFVDQIRFLEKLIINNKKIK